jgi:F0F1-type ATP synthase membrane subunit b/b'
MVNDPEQIRREIEHTRSELSDNVNALGDKVNPGSIAKRQVSRVRGAATSVKDAVMGSAADAADTGHQVASTVNDAVSHAPNAVARKAQGSPIAAGLIAFGAGLLISSLIPSSQKEQDAVSTLQDNLEPLKEKATEAAKDVAAQLKEPAQEAAESVKATAAEGAENVRAEGVAAKDEVQGQVADSKSTVQGQVADSKSTVQGQVADSKSTVQGQVEDSKSTVQDQTV